MKKLGLFAALTLIAVTASAAIAESKVDWSKCASEIAKFNCAGKDDEGTYSCLLAHDSELSDTCDEQHAAYEKATGKKAE